MKPIPCNLGHSRKPNPNAGDNCTTIPDAIGVAAARLIDFSDSCRQHDACYGFWLTERRECDDAFGANLHGQCNRAFELRVPLIGVQVDPRLGVCGKFADLLYYGVQQLGNLSWYDKAHRYAPLEGKLGGRGCPFLNSTYRAGDAHTACVEFVHSRSYGPYVVNVQMVVKQLAQKAAEAWIPIWG